MPFSLQTLKDDIAGAIHGTTVTKITNLSSLINRSASEILLDVDLAETKRITSLGLVFNSVYDYSSPSDLKGNRIIDIRPQAGRKGDVWPQRFNQWFDKKKWLKNQNQFTVQHNQSVKSLRVDAPFLSAPITISDTGSTSSWSASGTASNITIDTVYNVAGAGALQFDVSTGTGYIENAALSAVDLSDHVGIAQEFFWAYFPSVPTSVSLRWGSSSSDYYSYSMTSQADGTSFRSGWNLLTSPWAGLTPTGTPVDTAYDYVRFTVVSPTNLVGVKFCSLTSNLGSYLEAEYYSKFFFRTQAGVFQETISASELVDSPDTIYLNVDTESYPIVFSKVMCGVSQQLQADDAKKDLEHFEKMYTKSLLRYKNMYPSEVQFSQEPYYEPTKGNYDGFVPKIYTP